MQQKNDETMTIVGRGITIIGAVLLLIGNITIFIPELKRYFNRYHM